MKIKQILTTSALIALILSTNCTKQQKTPQIAQNNNIEEPSESYENITARIDFNKMETIIEKSKTMNTDVFFAISVLHKKYISNFIKDTENMTEKQQNEFFIAKKNEFFNSIKFSEDQYNTFMENNAKDLNNYINQYPEIASYLTSVN